MASKKQLLVAWFDEGKRYMDPLAHEEDELGASRSLGLLPLRERNSPKILRFPDIRVVLCYLELYGRSDNIVITP